MVIRWWPRGLVLISVVMVVMAMKALFPDFIAWSRTFHRNEHLVVPLQLPSNVSFGSASQDNTERGQDNPKTSINRPLIYHNNDTYLYEAHNIADIKAVQVRRRRRVDDGCRQLNAANWTTSKLREMAGRKNTLFVDDRLHYVYCLVPKVACTTWTRVLLIASGKVRQKNPNDIPQTDVGFYRYQGRKLRRLARYSIEAIDYRLKNYFKFMFVRHPLERLVSAFRDRLHGEHAKPRRTLSAMILRHLASRPYANQSTSIKQRQGGGVTFSEFIRYVVDPVNVPADANWHWRPQYDLCYPCHIRYDFIGHYDTLRRDADVVLATIGAADRVQFPTTDRDNRRRHRTSELLANMYADISAQHVQLLKTKVYGNDFLLFDFN